MKLPKPIVNKDRDSDFNPFLKTVDIGKANTAAVITLTGEDARIQKGAYGQQVIVSVKLKSKAFDWAIGITSVNYRMLVDRFGLNPKKWKGPVKVRVQKPQDPTMKPYIAVLRG